MDVKQRVVEVLEEKIRPVLHKSSLLPHCTTSS